MKLEDAPELNRNPKSQIKEIDLEDHLIRSKFWSWDHYALAAHSDQQQEVPDTPGSGIWTCRSRVVRMQPREYIRKPSGVRKSKYTCTDNRWNCMKTCLCMHEIMFKSYQ